MQHASDTIAAIITPPGQGGIAALRLAGDDSVRIALQTLFTPSGVKPTLQPMQLQLCHLRDASGHTIDEVMAVMMPHGHSYTGQEQVELFCHGSDLVARLILSRLLACGARAAEPGEFSKRAFLNGKIDLTKAEAIAELISAGSTHAYEVAREHLIGGSRAKVESIRNQIIAIKSELEAAIDFADEAGYSESEPQLGSMLHAASIEVDSLIATYKTGRILKDGFTVVLAGRPNAGKSSLFNRLLQYDRALVTPIAGTTRDFLGEWIEIGGVAVQLIDTAGIREGGEIVEELGIARSRQKLSEADLVLWLFDISQPDWESLLDSDLQDLRQTNIVLVGNKIDASSTFISNRFSGEITRISCLLDQGIDLLRAMIEDRIRLAAPDLSGRIVITSERQQQSLAAVLAAISRAEEAHAVRQSAEIVALELQEAIGALDEITGRIYTEEILGNLFGRFCIGK